MIASWPEPPGWPDRPDYPYPPLRPEPRREGPLLVPVVDLPRGGLDRPAAPRRVLVTGRLDAATTNQAAAELMALDGQSDEPVELYVNSDGGPLADVVALLDIIALMRAPVRTVCVGRATGTAAVLLACGTGGRRAGRHAMISLRCAPAEMAEGSPDEVRRQADEIELVRRQVTAAVAGATGRTASDVADQLERGGLLDSDAAQRAGIIDTVGTTEPGTGKPSHD